MSILGFIKKMAIPDPTAQLKKEHARFRTLLEQAKKTTERSALKRKKIFLEFSTLLALHETVEEKALYAALLKVADLKSIVLEGVQEHHVADLMVEELKHMDVTHLDWGSKFHVMGESIEHHLEEEEKKMFPQVKKVLSEKALLKLSEKMDAIRNRTTTPRRTAKVAETSKVIPKKRKPATSNKLKKTIVKKSMAAARKAKS